jgi:hypothetical protein
MTQLEKVVYTATAHTTRGRDGASRSDDGRLDVKVSSPGTPGTGTNAEMNHSPTAKLVFPRRRMIKSAVSSAPTWRSFLASSAVAGALGLVLLAARSRRSPPLPHQRSGRGTRRPPPTRGDETVIVVGLKPGPHKVLIELADPTHKVITSETVKFTLPDPKTPR